METYDIETGNNTVTDQPLKCIKSKDDIQILF